MKGKENEMKLRQIIAALLAGTVLLAACGGKKAAATANATASVEQTAPIKYYCRTRGPENAPDNAKVQAYIEGKTGIKMELTAIANESYREKIDLMIASDESFDGMNLVGYGNTYTELVEKNAIIPINDLLDQYGPNVKRVMADGLYSTTDRDGKIWTVPRAERFPQGYVPTIRQDWLAALNMDMPSTMEELDAYLAAVKANDLNGNGDPNDEIPLLPNTLTYGISNFFPYFLKAKENLMTASGFSAEARYMAEDGTIRPIIGHPDMIKLIAKFREWYQKGYMSQDIHLLKTAQMNDIRITGRVGMQAGWYLDGSSQIIDWSSANPDKPPARYDPILPLQNAPSGRSVWLSNPRYAPQIMFMRSGKNTVALMRYFDWICSSQENCAIVNFGIPGEHWNWAGDGVAEISNAGQQGYSDYLSMANLYWPGLMPKIQVASDNEKTYDMFRLMDTIRAFPEPNYPFDAHIPYSFKGTDAEFLTADGRTLIEETLVKMVIGDMPLSEWDRTLATYNRIEGDILSKVWTDQYYAFTGQPRP
jgi:putative aldouronate transport system substrate-binding protein